MTPPPDLAATAVPPEILRIVRALAEAAAAEDYARLKAAAEAERERAT